MNQHALSCGERLVGHEELRNQFQSLVAAGFPHLNCVPRAKIQLGGYLVNGTLCYRFRIANQWVLTWLRSKLYHLLQESRLEFAHKSSLILACRAKPVIWRLDFRFFTSLIRDSLTRSTRPGCSPSNILVVCAKDRIETSGARISRDRAMKQWECLASRPR